MANTEGMSDETMASLLTPSSSLSSAGTATIMTKKKHQSAFARQRERLRQRMDQPIATGDRPAATVIRPSRPTQRLDTDYTTTTTTSQQSSTPANVKPCLSNYGIGGDDETMERTPPILGAVVEREVHSVSNGGRTPTSDNANNRSHFSQRRHNSGFPSLDMPIGTFVNNMDKQSTVAPRQEERPRMPLHPSARTQTSGSIQKASQAMLDQMSCDEIHDNVQELRAALSPETIAFLQKRGQRKRTQQSSPTTIHGTPIAASTESRVNKQQKPPTVSNVGTEVEEKQRVASLLSSIKTVEELDELYTQEIGFNDDEEQTAEPEKDDFDIACKLLRSTSPRQALWAAKVVCQRLQADVSAGKSFSVDQDKDWPYPPVLVVSLRCLLDSPVSQSNGFILYTFVLQSLYALLQLRAHTDHVVDVSGGRAQTTSSIYQEYFLDDAVPSLAFGTCYPTMTVQPVTAASSATNESSDNVVAYATDSSSTSAVQDGEAFAKDPMWTLLTRMRILPRLAQLLSGSPSRLTDEALVAICGILSMLAVRSVGTASAIAQHQTILPSLLSVAVLPPISDECAGFFNTRISVPAMLFLCTLARQSRVSASAIPVDSIVPPILAMTVENYEEHRLKQWSLILWRSVLRYGLCLSSLSTIISLSIRHLASERPSKYSLAAEFLSSFSNVCHCARIAQSKPPNDWNRFISDENSEVLENALDWLDTTARQTIQHIKNSTNESDMRVVAARVKFLQSYASASDRCTSHGGENNEFQSDDVDWHGILVALKHFSESCNLADALRMVPVYGCDQVTLDKDDGWVDVVSARSEATACAFVDNLSTLLYTLSSPDRHPFTEEHHREVLASVTSNFRTAFVDWMNTPFPNAFAGAMLSSPRRGWINATMFHVLRSVLPSTASSFGVPDWDCVRSHVFRLIGNLQLGEEAFAAVLFSNDTLFRTDGESRSNSSLLSSFLMQELCATPSSRRQLDHSFKLHGGFGITENEWGSFDLDTLLSESDTQGARSSSPFSELLLPAGPLWLWKILCGAIVQQPQEEDVVNGEDEAAILAECLELLELLEDRKLTYATQTPDGAKLYYLMNVFLQSEHVIRDDRIINLVSFLFAKYTERLRKKDTCEETPLFESFWKACIDHSQVSRNVRCNTLDPKDEKLVSVLVGSNGMAKTELRPLLDFVVDVSRAYVEFGAQYESFTRCIRVFLSVAFPPQVRCEAMRSLQEVLHLLTLSEEDENICGHEMMDALNMCLYGDSIDPDEAVRDSSEFLDLIISVMNQDESAQASPGRWSAAHGGFFYLLGIASLARNLVASIKDNRNEDAMRRRLESLPAETRDIVYEVVSLLQTESNGQIRDVAATVASVVMEYR